MQDKSAPLPWWRRNRRRLGYGLLLWLVLVGVVHTRKPLPPGMDVAGSLHGVPAAHVAFLADVTYTEEKGQSFRRQALMDRMLTMVENAEQFILLDLFLFNDHKGEAGEVHRRLCDELAEALLEKRRSHPRVPIVFITDPINNTYGADPLPQLTALQEAGVQVVVTDLDRLRDSNPLFSSPWRTFVQWFGTGGKGPMPHPFAKGKKVSLRSWLRMANFKANHRKLVVADHRGEYWQSLVMSANPHDGSSAHGNVGLWVRSNALAQDIYESERGIAGFSGHHLQPSLPKLFRPALPGSKTQDVALALVTEKAILASIKSGLHGAEKGDRVDLAMFYLSHREVVQEIILAARRGVEVRVILDPNKDAFGRQKGGIPNRQVAAEFMAAGLPSLQVRWYDTRGEQFHSKLLLVRKPGVESHLLLGSANFTRRNLDNYNLEANLQVRLPPGHDLELQVADWFDTLWQNRLGSCTLDYSAYADERKTRKLLYRFMEKSGMCTF